MPPLKIALEDNGKYLEEEQGMYKVIFLNFRDINVSTYKDFLFKIIEEFKEVYDTHFKILLLFSKK